MNRNKKQYRFVERIPLYGEEKKEKEEIMVYEITTYKLRGNKRIRISAAEIQARDAIVALERAGINLNPDRVIEIRLKQDRFEAEIERPRVNRQDPSAIH